MERIVCETPTPGKKPTTIPRWKYDLVRNAILDAVPAKEPGLRFSELPAAVAERISEEQLEELGSVAWHTTTVKLDLEVKGEIARVKGSGPQQLVRSQPKTKG